MIRNYLGCCRRRAEVFIFIAAVLLVFGSEAFAADRFDVTEYGAFADGINDDSAAVLKAVDAAREAGGGTVYFPAGNFLIEQSITLPSDITVSGGNAKISFSAGDPNEAALFLAEDAENIKIENLCVIGEGYAKALFDAKSVRKAAIKGNRVGGMALVFGEGGCREFVIEENELSADGSQQSAVEFDSYGGVVIRKNIISDYILSVALNAGDANIEENNLSGGGIKINGISGGIVRGNNINNSKSAGIAMNGCRNCIVSANNIVSDARTPISLSGDNQNIGVTSNTVRSTSPGVTLLKIGDEKVQNRLINISQNKFLHEPGENGTDPGEGFSKLEISDADALSFNDNYLCNVSISAGINCDMLNIGGNMLYLENLVSEGFCALAVNAGGECVITGNSVINRTGQQSGVLGISAEESGGTVSILNNSVSGFDTELEIISKGMSPVIVRNNCFADAAADLSRADTGQLVFSGNRNAAGAEINLESIMTGASERVKYFADDPQEYIGRVYDNGSWKSFGKIGPQIKLLSLTLDEGRVNALLRGGDIENENVLVIAVYDSGGRLIRVCVEKESRDYMYEGFNTADMAPGAQGSIFQVRWACTPWVYDDASADNVALVSSAFFGRNDENDMCIRLDNENIWGDRFYFYPYRSADDMTEQKRSMKMTEKTGNQSELLSFRFALEESGVQNSGAIEISLNSSVSLSLEAGRLLSFTAGESSIALNKEFDGLKWHKLGFELVFLGEERAKAALWFDSERITEYFEFDASGSGVPEVGSESFANNTLWSFRVFNFTGARENNEIIKGSSDIFYIDDLSIKLDAVEGTITNSAELDKNAGKVKAFVWKSMEDMLPIHKGEEIIMSDEE